MPALPVPVPSNVAVLSPKSVRAFDELLCLRQERAGENTGYATWEEARKAARELQGPDSPAVAVVQHCGSFAGDDPAEFRGKFYVSFLWVQKGSITNRFGFHMASLETVRKGARAAGRGTGPEQCYALWAMFDGDEGLVRTLPLSTRSGLSRLFRSVAQVVKGQTNAPPSVDDRLAEVAALFGFRF
jgi:hypothetical protein